MKTLSEVQTIFLGNQSVANIWLGDTHVWPKQAEATLAASWTYPAGATYNINAMAASESYAYATWTLTVVRNNETVYSGVVTPTGIEQISDATNFPYTLATGTWKANSRGTNDYVSGTTAPTPEQMNPGTRSCTLKVKFEGNVTINGVSTVVSALGEATMTQVNNVGQYIAAQNSYSDLRVWLGDYGSSADACPAKGGTTTISASGNCANAIKWTSNATAFYTQALSSTNFTATTTASWVTIYDNYIPKQAVVESCHTTRYDNGRTATIKATVTGTGHYVTTTLYQEPNVIVQTLPAADNVQRYELDAISQTIPVAGGTVTLTGKWSGTHKAEEYVWSSEEHSGGAVTTVTRQSANPDSYKIGSSGTEVTGNSWSVASNGRHTTTKTYYVYGKYAGVWSSSVTATQAADSYTDSTENYNFAVSLTASSDTMSAADGAITFNAYSATYRTRTLRTWASDPSNPDTTSDTAKTASVSQSNITVTKGGTAYDYASRISYNHSTRKVTHTTMGANRGTDSVTVRLTHPLDSSTYQDYSKTVTNSPSYGAVTVTPENNNQIPARGGNKNFTATCPVSWTSGTSTTLSTGNFTFTVTTKGNGNDRVYGFTGATLQLGSLEQHTKNSTATTYVKATYTEDSSVYGTSSCVEATNRRTDSLYASGSTTTFHNATFSVTFKQGSTSLDQNHPVTKNAGNASFSFTAKHQNRTTPWTQTLHVWESDERKLDDPVNGTTTSVYVSDLGTLNFNIQYSTGQSGWVGIQGILEKVNVGEGTAQVDYTANQNDARYAMITVTRPALTDEAGNTIAASPVSKYLYQKAGNLWISASPIFIEAPYDGTQHSYNITVTSNTSWALTYTNETYGVFTSNTQLSPRSGSAGRTTVVAKVPARTVPAGGTAPDRGSWLYFTATNDDDPKATASIYVSQTQTSL